MAAALLNLQRIVRTFTPLSALARSYYVRPVVPSTLDPATHRIGFGPHSVPAPAIKQPADFLKRIGRGAETKLSAETWDALWRMDGNAMKKAGVGVRDRRYIQWCMEKFRLGFPIEEFAHEPSPKKTIRGWGPKVQNGKRIRSRRVRDKKKKAKMANASRPISLV
ncbi:hypothetical protein HYPSUDRAFT_39941 [Hypholoma sublateritium FD-334 SS-4]|uniref:Small ribosomal subunit protein mS41 n=1 Tax=Hypholoma sublateritium (strain FD-334 SS-4) TaxID=945553 RepID=A0A0D2MHQ2_HYPSF|nr:hypothetical protein HYPSUDRAFT_39941 [Hypholoma sublateritium FD-334 SS-4]